MKASRVTRRGPSPSTTGNPNICTPNSIIIPIRAYAGGLISLDPCSNQQSVVGAAIEWYGPPDGICGLERSWKNAIGGKGVVYVNPPYTRGVVDVWAERLRAEGRSALRYGFEIIALLPLRPSSGWQSEHILPSYDAKCDLGKRVKFVGSKSCVPWESSLFYWGPAPRHFGQHFQGMGYCDIR